MPIEYWILRDANITYARWYDHIDTAQMRRNFESYLIDPHYRAGRPELIDLSRVTSSDVDIGGVMMIFNKANAQDFGQNSGTLTFILAPDEKSYGHSRRFQSLPKPGAVFRYIFPTQRQLRWQFLIVQRPILRAF